VVYPTFEIKRQISCDFDKFTAFSEIKSWQEICAINVSTSSSISQD